MLLWVLERLIRNEVTNYVNQANETLGKTRDACLDEVNEMRVVGATYYQKQQLRQQIDISADETFNTISTWVKNEETKIIELQRTFYWDVSGTGGPDIETRRKNCMALWAGMTPGIRRIMSTYQKMMKNLIHIIAARNIVPEMPLVPTLVPVSFPSILNDDLLTRMSHYEGPYIALHFITSARVLEMQLLEPVRAYISKSKEWVTRFLLIMDPTSGKHDRSAIDEHLENVMDQIMHQRDQILGPLYRTMLLNNKQAILQMQIKCGEFADAVNRLLYDDGDIFARILRMVQSA